MRREKIDISQVYPNEGQIEGLPANPRLIKDGRFKKLVKSIQDLPEMTEARDLLVYPHDGGYIVIGGNMRLRAYQELGWKEVPCCVLPDNMPADKLRAMVIQDNNPFGEDDWDMLANEWDAEELNEWGFDVWQEPKKEDKKSENSKQPDEEPEKADFFDLMLGDRIYDSNNEFDIPTLRTDRQPENGLLLPFAGWGADTRAKKGISTYHFYVEDYRFTAIWKDPTLVLKSGQECGAKVYADLNVSQKFYKWNRMGIPEGYNAFATRGYADREEYLKMEIQAAREISGLDKPNMIVYGGGERIKELCVQNNVLYVEQFMANRGKKKGGNNG